MSTDLNISDVFKQEPPKIELVDLSTLHPHPDNPRSISERKFKLLEKSITELVEMLWLRPMIYNGERQILGGNMRLIVCKKLGLTHAPAIAAEQYLPLYKEREFMVKDNVPFGDWDFEALANNWDQSKLSTWGVEQIPKMPKVDAKSDRKAISDAEVLEETFNRPADNSINKAATRLKEDKSSTTTEVDNYDLLVHCRDKNHRIEIRLLLEGAGFVKDVHFSYINNPVTTPETDRQTGSGPDPEELLK